MRELDVRRALYESEIRRVVEKDPSTLVIDELGLLQGKFRIDVAVINGRFHGYEIKSASDNLDRLAAQQSTYNQIFDRMTLVADERHVAQALKIIPDWWGLIAVSMRDGQPFLNEIWPSRHNYSIEPISLCQLLWREEALQMLADMGLASSVRTKSRKLMWQMLTAVLTLDELRAAVSYKLKNRTGWRSGLPAPARTTGTPFELLLTPKPRRKRKISTGKKRRKVYSARPSGKSPARR